MKPSLSESFSSVRHVVSHAELSTHQISEVADSSSRVRLVSTLFFSTSTTPMSQQLWLRCEKKEFERRAALSPKIAKSLIDAGFLIHVERDEQRIFDDSEYESCAYLR